jgi:hypothetical protein
MRKPESLQRFQARIFQELEVMEKLSTKHLVLEYWPKFLLLGEIERIERAGSSRSIPRWHGGLRRHILAALCESFPPES